MLELGLVPLTVRGAQHETALCAVLPRGWLWRSDLASMHFVSDLMALVEICVCLSPREDFRATQIAVSGLLVSPSRLV
jgi:hypothetical protein